MMFLVILLIFRLVMRRNWAAFLVFTVFAGITMLLNPTLGDRSAWVIVYEILTTILVVATMITCLLRFGLLSVIGGIGMIGIMGWSNLTWDFQQWYAGSSLITMVAVLAVAGWAFYISLAGRSLFKDSVLD